MVGYGRFRKSSKVNRSNRGMYRSSITSGYGSYSKRKKTTYRRYYLRNKGGEKKYIDRAMVGNGSDAQVTGVNVNDLDNGFMYASSSWNAYDFASPTTTSSVSNDLLKGLGQGTTATSRIGNKVTAGYIKGAITLTAAKLAGASTGETNGLQNGESIATPGNSATVWEYLRTTFRICIVKDLQVNSVDGIVAWNDVFENASGAVGETGGVHAELKVANMGRFRILSDQLIKTDAVCPQETVRFMVRSSQIGEVRYNGPSADALTDKGIYIIWSAYTANVIGTVQTATTGMTRPGVTMHSRFCFTDE